MTPNNLKGYSDCSLKWAIEGSVNYIDGRLPYDRRASTAPATAVPSTIVKATVVPATTAPVSTVPATIVRVGKRHKTVHGATGWRADVLVKTGDVGFTFSELGSTPEFQSDRVKNGDLLVAVKSGDEPWTEVSHLILDISVSPTLL